MKKKKNNLIFIFLLVFLVLNLFNISSLDFRVAKAVATIYANYSSGSDTTGDGSSGNPYKTFHKAYTMASNGDTLDLTGTFDWSNADETGDASTTGYTVAKTLTISGHGADQTIIQAASTPNTAGKRVFTLNAAVTLQYLTVRYGYNNIAGHSGTAIQAGAALTIESCHIDQNKNHADRYVNGAIHSGGNLKIRNSTVSNNENGYAGGVYVYGSGNEITNSTFFNNYGEYYGGVYLSSSGIITITNSTFVGNQSSGLGLWYATAYIKNSIFANKTNGVDLDRTGGSLFDNGYNIVETQNAAHFTNGVNNNLVGDQANMNIASSLALNGSSTAVPNLALQASSVAINSADPADGANNSINIPVTDQRGYYRASTTDRGAYEYEGTLTIDQPTSQSSSVVYSSVSYATLTVGWTNGNGARRAVFMRQANSGTALPVDNTTYTANAAFGSGTQIGSTSWYCIYNGAGSSVAVTGLVPATDYIVQVFDYNGSSGVENYLTDSATDNPKTQATPAVTEPTVQTTNFTFSSVNYTQMTVGWTNGNGEKRAVFAKQANSGTALPVDGTTYTANAAYGSGTQIGSTGWYCIYNSTSNSVTVTGLTPGTDYIFQAFEYNGTAGLENYFSNSAADNPKVQSSLVVSEPATQASTITFSSVSYNQMTVSWTNGDGAKRVVFMRQANSGTASPVDNTAYTASTTFGSGTQIGSTGWYCIYNSTSNSVTVTGITPSTDYIVQVFEYNESGATRNYNANSASSNPNTQITTAVLEPTTQATNITFSSVSHVTMTVNWSNGNGENRIVFVKQADSGTASPVDNATYTANAAYGSGTQIGSTGWYAVYKGTATSVALTGLSASTTYIAQVFEYNGTAGIENYFTDSAANNPKAQVTTATPTEFTLGTGTLATGSTTAAPVNIYYQSLHGQSVYTAAEINAAGISGALQITQIGFYVASAPSRALPNFVIRMKHTTDANVASWQTSTGMETVYSTASYTPTAGGFDMITLTTPFDWNGTDNIVVDTAFSIVSWSSTGTVRYYTLANGYRCARSDSSNQTNVFSGGEVSSNKPQIKIVYIPTVSSYNLTYSAGSHGSISGSSPQTVNTGGNGTAVTAVPDTGYHFVNWSDASTQNPRTDTSVAANISVTANFAIDTFTLDYSAGAHGSLTGSVSQVINYGGSGTAVTAVPDIGYLFEKWSDDILSNPRTDANITSTLNVIASFIIRMMSLNYSAGSHGALSGDDSQSIEYNTTGTPVEAVPDTGYHFVDWSDASIDNPRTDSGVTDDLSISANFDINSYSLKYGVVAEVGSGLSRGSISGSSSQDVDYGGNSSQIEAIPSTGYHFVDWTDSSIQNPRLDTNVTSNLDVKANFEINTYTLAYSSGLNGLLNGDTSQTVDYGENGTAIEAIPNSGYVFSKWSDDVTDNPRTDVSVAVNISVTAEFASIGGGDERDDETEPEEIIPVEEASVTDIIVQTIVNPLILDTPRPPRTTEIVLIENNDHDQDLKIEPDLGKINLTVRVMVDNQPLKFTKVILHSSPREGVTDGDGFVTFYNIEPGDHKIKFVHQDRVYENKITLSNTEKVVNITIQAEPKNNLSILWILLGLLASILVIIFIRKISLKKIYRKIR